MTTDRPYTDADLRMEAASQYRTATEDPDFMGIGEQMQDSVIDSRHPDADGSGGETWDDLAPHEFSTAQHAIDDLLTSAADLSIWAIDLGADGLNPVSEALSLDAGVRIHFAFAPDMPDDVRRAWINGIGHAIREGL